MALLAKISPIKIDFSIFLTFFTFISFSIDEAETRVLFDLSSIICADKLFKVLVSGGGRKNKTLIQKIKSRTLKNLVIQPIDDYGVDGDYVESQAFAFLAIRSFLELPISFPDTTGCKSPTTGGEVVKNF